jgi:hypothetical protein
MSGVVYRLIGLGIVMPVIAIFIHVTGGTIIWPEIPMFMVKLVLFLLGFSVYLFGMYLLTTGELPWR